MAIINQLASNDFQTRQKAQAMLEKELSAYNYIKNLLEQKKIKDAEAIRRMQFTLEAIERKVQQDLMQELSKRNQKLIELMKQYYKDHPNDVPPPYGGMTGP